MEVVQTDNCINPNAAQGVEHAMHGPLQCAWTIQISLFNASCCQQLLLIEYTEDALPCATGSVVVLSS